MAWTSWRKVADRNEWYSDQFDWDGPACYELGLAGPRGGDLQPVYVGETKNEQARIAAYASHGSHLSPLIDYHLRQGWALWYRAQSKPSKAAAVRMQDSLLARFKYDWNRQLNTDDED